MIDAAGRVTVGDLSIHRLGLGTMRFTGPGSPAHRATSRLLAPRSARRAT